MVAENVAQELAEQAPMVSEAPPAAVLYRVFVPAAGRVTVIGEHPEDAWNACGAPSAAMVNGVTEQPERPTVVDGPELATVIWIMLFMFAVIEKVPELPTLFRSPGYVPVIVADAFGV
jgi:hypothetical protein